MSIQYISLSDKLQVCQEISYTVKSKDWQFTYMLEGIIKTRAYSVN